MSLVHPPRKAHFRWYACVIGGALLLVYFLVWNHTPISTSGDLSRFETERWQAPGWIYMRLEARGSESILLKHSDRGAVYRFDPRKEVLALLEPEAWDGAETPIVDCLRQAAVTRSPAVIGPPDWELKVEGGTVATAGKTALSLRVAPSRDRAAVLSASGQRNTPLIPFWGAVKGASGQHYHEVFSHPDYRHRTKAVRIPMGHSEEIVEGCWSPKEKFVVYVDQNCRYISFVPAEDSLEPEN